MVIDGAPRRAPHERADRPHPVTIAGVWLGNGLALSFLTSEWGHSVSAWGRIAVLAALITALWLGTRLARSSVEPARWIGRACWLALLACYALWLYLAGVFGYLLGWTLPAWMLAGIALLAVGAAVTTVRPPGRWRIPWVLPLGIWIASVLAGWLREENRVRCDDLAALHPPVELLVRNPMLADCAPGERRPSGRFPRTIWEAPDGSRLIFTTQGRFAPGGWSGAACEVTRDPPTALTCIGPPLNKAQAIVDIPERDVLLVLHWGIPIPSGSLGGVIYELPRSAPLAIRAEHWFDELFGEAFYEARNATLYLFSDRINGIHRATLPDFSLQPVLPSGLMPHEIRYDQERGEGVACSSGLGVAIRGAPFSERSFSQASWSPLDRLAMTWGCDWDADRRTVYTTVPNLGLLAEVDYDSGRVEQRWFVGPGMRSVAYDRARQRVYFTNFLRGEVLAFDLRLGRVVDRWFVGRFSRWVRLTRDGRALLATGNLGIVRIPLPPLPEAPGA